MKKQRYDLRLSISGNKWGGLYGVDVYVAWHSGCATEVDGSDGKMPFLRSEDR